MYNAILETNNIFSANHNTQNNTTNEVSNSQPNTTVHSDQCLSLTVIQHLIYLTLPAVLSVLSICV